MEENPSGLYCAEVKNYFSISAIALSILGVMTNFLRRCSCSMRSTTG